MEPLKDKMLEDWDDLNISRELLNDLDEFSGDNEDLFNSIVKRIINGIRELTEKAPDMSEVFNKGYTKTQIQIWRREWEKGGLSMDFLNRFLIAFGIIVPRNIMTMNQEHAMGYTVFLIPYTAQGRGPLV